MGTTVTFIFSLFLWRINGQVATADITNGTGEFYYFTNANQIPVGGVSCGSVGLCYIECNGEQACYGSTAKTIIGDSAQHLVIDCGGGDRVCNNLYVQGATDTVDINCIGPYDYICEGASFQLSSTSNVNIVCDSEGKQSTYYAYAACYDATITATNSDNVDITCVSDDDCRGTTINVGSVSTRVTINANGDSSLYQASVISSGANKLNLNCNKGASCSYLELTPNYQQQYSTSIYCSPLTSSCSYFEVYITVSSDMTNNFMEAICSRKSISGSCDFDFYCSDVSTSASTSMSFSTSQSSFYCTNDVCCPWQSRDGMRQNSTSEPALPNAIAPTSTNSTGEYYKLQTAESNRIISCTNSNLCHVWCRTVDSCKAARIYAGDSDNLIIECSGNSACPDIYVTRGPKIEANIYCRSNFDQVCTDAVFALDDTSTVNLDCYTAPGAASYYAYANCYGITLLADNADIVDIACNEEDECRGATFRVENAQNAVIAGYGDSSLYQVEIYGENAGNLEIYCYDKSTCYYIDVYPPYQIEYVFTLFCNSKSSSCSSVSVNVPSSSSFTNNYMQLLCPPTDLFSSACNIDWYCLDVSTTSVQTNSYFYSSEGYYGCADDELNCCPWKDDNTKSNIIMTSAMALPNSVEPTSTDSNGEYYTFASAGTSSDSLTVSCGDSNGCYITCSGGESCSDMTIYAGDTDYLQLICSNENSCAGLFISQGPRIKADIECSGPYDYLCNKGVFIFNNTQTVNITCDGTGRSSTYYAYSPCYNLEVRTENVTTLDVNCINTDDCYTSYWYLDNILESATLVGTGEDSLYSSNVYASDIEGKLNIICNGVRSCGSLNVYPPYLSTYDFSLYCAEVSQSCYSVDIYAPIDEFETNYMSLDCPVTDPDSRVSNQCSVGWDCDSTKSSSTTWSSTNERYECYTSLYYNEEDGQYCCPWIDMDYMTAPRECAVVDGRFCGSTLFTKGFNIWTLESSGNNILDYDYLNENTGGSWTDEGATCSLSSLEFTSSFSSYGEYAESDSVSIEGAYSGGAGSAGGSLSSSRSEIKSFSIDSQSYIYTLDVDCQTATVSIVQYNNIYWDSTFIQNLLLLPSSYSSSDLDEYESFWNKYGTHIIQTGKLGGSIRGAIAASKCSVLSDYSSESEYEGCLNAEYKGAEGEGCYGESSSVTDSKSAETSIGISKITVKGGSTNKFASVINEFGTKNNDFQSWIYDLAVFPDIIGGNLDEIHDVITKTVNFGNHKLNEGLSSSISDSQWLLIASAMKQAYEEKSSQLETDDLDLGQCAITCQEGTVDVNTCSCSDCSEAAGCCNIATSTNKATNHTFPYSKYFVYLFSLFIELLFFL